MSAALSALHERCLARRGAPVDEIRGLTSGDPVQDAVEALIADVEAVTATHGPDVLRELLSRVNQARPRVAEALRLVAVHSSAHDIALELFAACEEPESPEIAIILLELLAEVTSRMSPKQRAEEARSVVHCVLSLASSVRETTACPLSALVACATACRRAAGPAVHHQVQLACHMFASALLCLRLCAIEAPIEDVDRGSAALFWRLARRRHPMAAARLESQGDAGAGSSPAQLPPVAAVLPAAAAALRDAAASIRAGPSALAEAVRITRVASTGTQDIPSPLPVGFELADALVSVGDLSARGAALYLAVQCADCGGWPVPIAGPYAALRLAGASALLLQDRSLPTRARGLQLLTVALLRCPKASVPSWSVRALSNAPSEGAGHADTDGVLLLAQSLVEATATCEDGLTRIALAEALGAWLAVLTPWTRLRVYEAVCRASPFHQVTALVVDRLRADLLCGRGGPSPSGRAAAPEVAGTTLGAPGLGVPPDASGAVLRIIDVCLELADVEGARERAEAARAAHGGADPWGALAAGLDGAKEPAHVEDLAPLLASAALLLQELLELPHPGREGSWSDALGSRARSVQLIARRRLEELEAASPLPTPQALAGGEVTVTVVGAGGAGQLPAPTASAPGPDATQEQAARAARASLAMVILHLA